MFDSNISNDLILIHKSNFYYSLNLNWIYWVYFELVSLDSWILDSNFDSSYMLKTILILVKEDNYVQIPIWCQNIAVFGVRTIQKVV